MRASSTEKFISLIWIIYNVKGSIKENIFTQHNLSLFFEFSITFRKISKVYLIHMCKCKNMSETETNSRFA